MTEPRYDNAQLKALAEALFANAGVEREKAASVAHYLVLADMMGHSTHGLALAAWYLQSVADGVMTKAGHFEIVSDKGPAIALNGKRLPGAWLTSEAVALACDRAQTYGTSTVVIADSHHIGCLAAYLTDATDKGLLVSITSSSPSGAQVAPFGGVAGVYTPDPVAYGIPTGTDPILIDISASITTANMAQRLMREGGRFPYKWVMEADGTPTDDPEALNRGGTLLPTGGLDHGQKGYGMALWAEAVTQGLAGYGRADAPKGTNAAVTVQVWDPEAFGGADAFLRQTNWLVEACKASPPRPGGANVRLPGEAAGRRVREAQELGVVLHPGIEASLRPWSERFGVTWPAPV